MTSVQQSPEAVLPTLCGAGYGSYRVRRRNFIWSVLTHAAALALLLLIVHLVPEIQPKILTSQGKYVPLTDYIFHVGRGDNGGGGGEHSKLQATQGAPPKVSLKQQLAPPTVIPPQKSKLTVEPTVAADSVTIPNPQMGDQLSKLASLSNGTGVAGGIGSGSGGGVGSGTGPGVGPGIFHVGGGVSAPVPVYAPEPEFSDEARKAKYQGLVTVSIVVGSDGRVYDAHVIRSLGMGLDEKALEGVRTWKFKPAERDGRPVPVQVSVDVNFSLF